MDARLESDCPVDRKEPTDEQLYPVPAAVADELVVAWEDRRPGHTIIMAAASGRGDPCAFSEPVRISKRSGGTRNLPYGKGHGVSRVTLAPFGASGLYAIWEDKRNFREGYDIYGALYLGKGQFDDNARVQDDFGEMAKQWHASLGGDAEGRLIAAWSDEREGNSDIFLSVWSGGQWNESTPLSSASGSVQQAHPSIVLDAAGNLHAAWVERDEVNGPTRLLYSFGKAE